MGYATWELLYRHLAPKTVKYVRSVVSYLDILGFSELIETRKAGEISHILRILAESVKPSPIFKEERIRFTKFSDTVIRSMPIATHYPHNFIFELRNLLHAQLALIPRGVPIRGAVTIGDVTQSWKVVYGPAVVKAYTLENQAGSPPRIVVDEDALASIQDAIEDANLTSELAGLVRKDGQTTFLDYLGACELELNVPEQEYTLFLELHRDFIHNNLTKYASIPAKLSKYQWLRDYHNRTLQERFGADLPQRLRV